MKHVNDLEKDNNDLTLYYNTFLELYMLAHGYSLVATYSAFNRLAIWLGPVEQRTIFYVEKCAEFLNESVDVPKV